MTKAAELAKMGEVLTNSQIGGRRNIVINGAMQVAQRATSFSNVSNADYTLDRFKSGSSGTELVYNIDQSTDTPNGFGNSYKVTIGTAESTLSSGDNLTIQTHFEGQDLQSIKKGTSDAEKVTVSFFVKSSVASTYSLELFDRDNTRVHGQKYTINSANTWEKKSITFDADTTGTFDDDNAKSLDLTFWLDAGSEYTSGTQSTTWQSNTASERVEQATGFMTTASATFFITGIQIEVGSVATPFEHRSFGDELALCQRYYKKIQGTSDAVYKRFGKGSNFSTTGAEVIIHLPTEMRSFPSLGTTAAATYAVYHGSTVTTCSAVPSLNTSSDDGVGNSITITCTVSSGLTVAQGATLLANNDASTYLELISEL